MKKLFLLLCGAILALPSFALSYFDYEYEDVTLEYLVTDALEHTVKVMSPAYEYYDHEEGGGTLPASLSIPSEVVSEGITYTVTEIRESAFEGFNGLKYVKIPETVRKFGAYAFLNCADLEGVEFPDIACLCSAIFKSNGYAQAYYSNPLYFAHNLYIDGKRVTNLVIPGSVTAINDYAFAGGSFTSAEIGEGVKAIGEGAFYKCGEMEAVSIPVSVKEIYPQAFKGCSSLSNAEFASIEAMNEIEYAELTSYESNPLYLAHNLYIAGEHVTDLGFPQTISAINEITFCGGSFTSIKLPASLKSIGFGAFLKCNVTGDVIVPSSVESVGTWAFHESSVGAIILEDGLSAINMGKQWWPAELTGLYIGRPHEADLAQSLSGLKWVRIGNLLSGVYDSEFESFTELESVIFGSGLTTIGNNAFAGCMSLDKVVLPPALDRVGNGAFRGCGLTEIVMGPDVAMLGREAFAQCPVKSVAITAQQAPAVGEDVFTDFGWNLMVQGEKAREDYASSSNFWGRQDLSLLTDMTYVKNESSLNVISGKPGDVYALAASVRGDDASLKEVFWRSTDPAIAIVNLDGIVTLQEGIDAAGAQCEIIAESLYADAPVVSIKVKGNGSGVNEIVRDATAIDYSAPYEVYGLDGRPAGKSVEGLAKGIYVIRQGNNTYKIIAK